MPVFSRRATPETIVAAFAAASVAVMAAGYLLDAIGKRPLLDFGMRLGEASAAALAVPILKAAAACHNGMATFTQAGVSSRSSS